MDAGVVLVHWKYYGSEDCKGLSSPQPILVCSKDKIKLLAVVWSAGEVLRSTQCCATLRKVAQLLRNVAQLLRNVTHLTYK